MYIVIVTNDVTGKSCEQRLITKEHIVMHTNLILLLYIFVTKIFKSSIAEILTVTL